MNTREDALAAARARFGLDKTGTSVADIGRAVITPPVNLLKSLGTGFQDAQAAYDSVPQGTGAGLVSRLYHGLPAAVGEGAAGFHNSGGTGAAALTGLGALTAYGGKKLYDHLTEPSYDQGYAVAGRVLMATTSVGHFLVNDVLP
jgi:hypothetical protein